MPKLAAWKMKLTPSERKHLAMENITSLEQFTNVRAFQLRGAEESLKAYPKYPHTAEYCYICRSIARKLEILQDEERKVFHGVES